MAATYIYKGETIDYTNPSAQDAIDAGDVIVLGTKARIGIAACDIPASGKGALHMIGVFELPKSSSAAITQGTAVYWDGTGITATSTSNTPAGYAAAPAAADDETIEVKLVG